KSMPVDETATYALGHSEQELERLNRQGALFEPFTRVLFEQAGISKGMRVLDVGCGSGDVALLAAEMVGSSGEVVAVDRSPAALEWSRRRAETRRAENIQFLE